jgi:hypothetical protein
MVALEVEAWSLDRGSLGLMFSGSLLEPGYKPWVPELPLSK